MNAVRLRQPVDGVSGMSDTCGDVTCPHPAQGAYQLDLGRSALVVRWIEPQGGILGGLGPAVVINIGINVGFGIREITFRVTEE
jgi:hypothetical protein